MKFAQQNIIVYLIWATLAVESVISLWLGQWDEAFIAILTLALTFVPIVFEKQMAVELPIAFSAMIVVFLFASLFMGEIGGFYERYWWWDMVLHSGSAIGFGLIGYVLVFMLFEGDRFAAPPIVLAVLSFCIAITIGTIWEVFEFAMDQIFGMNMQKSGIVDTMWDIIVNIIGASIGAAAGYFYQKGRKFGGLSGMIDQFVKANKRFFNKHK